MRELSLHILDIVQNSIAAGASRIIVSANADDGRDLLAISVSDNGRGMTPEMVERVRSPFCTTRTTRKVGLGIPMLAAAAEACDGELNIDSKPGSGTKLCVTFKLSHIDRAPFGDIVSTMIDAIVANPEISFRYEQKVDGKEFQLDTDDIKRELGEVPIETPSVRRWMQDYLSEGIAQVGAIP